MQKNNRTTLRLGSFELLESRALLAHAGLPQGMLYEMHDDRQATDFNRGPRMEMQARSMDAREVTSFGSARGPRGDGGSHGDFGPPNRSYNDSVVSSGYSSVAIFETVPAIVFIPSAPVLIIVTLPPPVPTTLQFSNPVTSSVRNDPPQSQRTSNNNLQTSPTTSRSASTSNSSLSSLSVFSDAALKRTTTDDSEETNDTESAAHATQYDEQSTRDEQESQQLARQPVANETALQTIEADEEADLIELDPAELLKRTKRKSARAVAAANIESSPARESVLQLERRLPRAAELQPAEIWQHESQSEEVFAPINDDLIELLAGDQVKVNPTANHSTPFTTPANLQLEANLGFHQAAELTDAAIPVEAQPAAVAATALPAGEAQ
jgi:hypothetical protein